MYTLQLQLFRLVERIGQYMLAIHKFFQFRTSPTEYTQPIISSNFWNMVCSSIIYQFFDQVTSLWQKQQLPEYPGLASHNTSKLYPMVQKISKVSLLTREWLQCLMPIHSTSTLDVTNLYTMNLHSYAISLKKALI